MKKLNRKGFTLVELLAVIVVLAVIMLLATTAIIPRMNSARRNAFITEAQTFIKGAEQYYQNQILEGQTPESCITINDLITKGFVNKDSGTYAGKIVLGITETNVTYTISISNNEFSISGKTPANLAQTGVSNIDDTTIKTDAASLKCS